MKHLRLLALCLFLPCARANDANPDAQYSIYMGENGIVVFELHIEFNGKSPQQIFHQYVDDLMVSLDANHDGVVTVEEANGKVLTPAQAAQASIIPTTDGIPPTLKPDAAPADGKITRQELLTYFRRMGLHPFLMTYMPRMMPGGAARRPRQVGNLSEAPLFSRLDGNGDGKISVAELRGGLSSLQKMDLDNDEMISEAELSPIANNVFVQPQPNAQTATYSPFLGTSSEESITKQIRRLIDKYDSPDRLQSGTDAGGKNQKLSRMELAISPAVFNRLDGDGDGQLDFDELRQFILAPEPTISIRLNLDSNDPLRAESLQQEFDDKIRMTSDGAANISLETCLLSVTRISSKNLIPADAILKPPFQAIDRDANGYLDSSEFNPAFFFGAAFDILDADKNGMIYFDEAVAYFKIRLDAARSRTVMTITEQGRTLFEILDADRDRRLSNRELVSAADRMSLWDKDQDGLLAESEVPLQYRLLIAQGNLAAFGGNAANNAVGRDIGSPSESVNGPVWFRRMDKNRDGEVSGREFLGDKAIFDKLDLNHDGYLDLNEALQAQ